LARRQRRKRRRRTARLIANHENPGSPGFSFDYCAFYSAVFAGLGGTKSSLYSYDIHGRLFGLIAVSLSLINVRITKTNHLRNDRHF
jgi:hypothetical protein